MTALPDEIRATRSIWKLLPLAIACAAFALGCGYVLAHEAQIKGWRAAQELWQLALGLALFGAGAMVMFRDLIWGGGKALVLRRSGLTDERVGSGEIPWSAVESCYELKISGAKQVGLRLWRPESETGVDWAQALKRGLGVEDVCVGTGGLDVSHAELFQAIQEYLLAARMAPERAFTPASQPSAFRAPSTLAPPPRAAFGRRRA
jgi:hypothetical protein